MTFANFTMISMLYALALSDRLTVKFCCSSLLAAVHIMVKVISKSKIAQDHSLIETWGVVIL